MSLQAYSRLAGFLIDNQKIHVSKEIYMLCAAVVVALAGSALGAEPTVEPISRGATVSATSATPVTVDARGRVISWGETVQLGGAAERGACNDAVPVFDSFGVTDTDGDGFFFDPVCGEQCGFAGPGSRYFSGIELQGFALDINTEPSPGRLLETLLVPATVSRCPDSQATEMFILCTLYDDIDTTGTGFDTDGDTVADTPFPPDDLDGNGIPDAFLGGVLLTFSPVPSTGGGYGVFSATGLDSLGIDLPADGTGGVLIEFVSGFVDLDGDTIPETPEPFEMASPLFWGPNNTVPNCPFTGSPSSSSGTWWTLGYDVCNDEPGFSPDPYTFVYDDSFFGAVSCPETFMPAITIFGSCPADRLCADQNSDGMIAFNDFTAWIANFNSNDLRADVNQDSLITPTDFTAWVSAFSQGANGPICYP